MRPASHARHERAKTLADVLLDLDGEHVRSLHLGVHELDDALKLRGDDVGDEDEADATRSEIRGRLLPEGVCVSVRAEMGCQLVRRVQLG